jgi:hypothetical protein
MVDEGVLDRRKGREPRTLSGRTCYAAIARLGILIFRRLGNDEIRVSPRGRGHDRWCANV